MSIIYIRLVFASLAFVIGAVQLMQKKGTKNHKVLGRLWIFAMMITAVSSFWIRSLRDGGFSWIHLLSVWTLFCLAAAVYFVRRKNIQSHKRFVIGAYMGLVAAGTVAALTPDRLIYTWLFG